IRSNGGGRIRRELALANGFALVNGAGPADARVDARLQPSRVAHNASAKRRSGSRIGMPPNVQRAEQHPPRCGDVPHRGVERRLIGLRGSVEAADLAHELQRRVVQLRVGRRMIRVPQALDVSAHDVRPFVILPALENTPGAMKKCAAPYRAGTPNPRAIAVAASTIRTTSTACTKLIRAKRLAARVSGTLPPATATRHRIRAIIGATSRIRIAASRPILAQKTWLWR